MAHVASTWVVLIVSCILVSGASRPSEAEDLYHWKDDAGTSYYSNVAPPTGTAGYSVVTGPDPEVKANAVSSLNTSPERTKPPADSDSYPDFLRRRIRDRQTAIHYIETLLKKCPGDLRLRKKLRAKRQNLFVDLTLLKNHCD